MAPPNYRLAGLFLDTSLPTYGLWLCVSGRSTGLRDRSENDRGGHD